MFRVLVRGVIAAALSLACLSASAQSVMRVTLQLPETHPLGQNWRAFQEIVEAETHGEVMVLMFPSAELFKDKDVPQAVGMGLVDAGSAFIGRFADQVPGADVIGLPFVFENPDHLARTVAPGSPARRLIDEAILKKTGARVLWWQAYGRNVYLSRGAPVRRPSDIAGMRVRTYDRQHHSTIRALGGGAMLTSGSDQYGVYQRQDVEVGMTGVTSVASRRLYEVMDTLTVSYDSAIEFVAVIHDEYFRNLSPRNQEIILRAARTVEAQLRDEVTRTEAQTVSSLRSKMQVVELTSAERDEWRQATAGAAQAYIAKKGPSAKAVYRAIQHY